MGEFHLDYTRKELSPKVARLGYIMLAIGLLSFVGGFAVDSLRASFNSLISFMFLLSIGLGSIFLVALEHIAGAVWSVPFRRIAEFFGATVIASLIFAVPVWLNLHDMYHWTHVEEVAKDPFLSQKAPYLNETFFYIRTGVIIAIIMLFYTIFTRNSNKQDTVNDQSLTKSSIKFSAIFMIVFALSITIMGIDYLMSLEPHWFSTIFGVYYFAGSFWVTMAVITLAVIYMNQNGHLPKGINKYHYYSLGGLMFAFTAFWTYIAFSQFMLIWYANIPEETFWFIPRMEGMWAVLSISLIFIHFVVPFGLLLQRPSKMNPNRLKLAAYWILFAHFYDLYWLAMPTYNHLTGSHTPPFGFMEIGFPIFALGVLITVFNFMAKGKNHVPVGDPKMQRAMEFHL